jgi:hypothetical protein
MARVVRLRILMHGYSLLSFRNLKQPLQLINWRGCELIIVFRYSLLYPSGNQQHNTNSLAALTSFLLPNCVVLGASATQLDIVNVSETQLWGRHPQFAAADVIPRADKNLSLIFYGGIVP